MEGQESPKIPSSSRPNHLFYDIEKKQVCRAVPKEAKILMPDGKISHAQAMTVPNMGLFIKEKKITQIESMPWHI